MPRPLKAEVQREFAYWLATPKRIRVSLGLPVSERQFSEMKDVDGSTLRRWKHQKAFQEQVESFRLELANASPDSTVRKIGLANPVVLLEDLERVTLKDDPVFDPGLSADEQKYLQVKDTLVHMAMDGNQGAMDLYLKHYGKAFVEAEQGDFADYRDMSDDRLVEELCRMMGAERVSRWLAETASVSL